MRSGFPRMVLTLAGLLCAGASAVAADGWHRDLPAGLEAAKAADRPVLVHFSAEWCGPCRQMEPVLRSAPVTGLLRDQAVGVHLDFDRNKSVAQSYGVRGLPADVLLTPDGRVLGQMSGLKEPHDYARRVRAVAAQYAAVRTRPRIAGKLGGGRAVAPRPPRRPNAGGGPAVPSLAKLDPSWEPPGLAAPEPGEGPRLGTPSPGTPSPDGSLGGAFGETEPSIPPVDPYGGRPDPFGPRPGVDPVDPVTPRTDRESARPVPGRPRVTRRPRRKLLGMRGFCPVTLHEQRDWVRGQRDFQWEHQGITYFLADEAAFDKFYENADRYAPRLLGCDPVLYRDEARAVPGSTRFAAIWRGDLFLFTSEETRATFRADPSAYANNRTVLLIEELEGAGTY